MADDELRSRVDGHDVDIAELKQLVNTMIVELVRPATEVAVAAQNRSLENEERSIENESRFQNLLDEAREDRMNAQKRFDAQQEVIQSLLIQIAQTNSDIDEVT